MFKFRKIFSLRIISLVVLFLFGGFSILIGVSIFRNPRMAFFNIGLGMFFIATALNTIALVAPKDNFNWKIIPTPAKELQRWATIFIGISFFSIECSYKTKEMLNN